MMRRGWMRTLIPQWKLSATDGTFSLSVNPSADSRRRWLLIEWPSMRWFWLLG
jgi:hypothetical protein